MGLNGPPELREPRLGIYMGRSVVTCNYTCNLHVNVNYTCNRDVNMALLRRGLMRRPRTHLSGRAASSGPPRAFVRAPPRSITIRWPLALVLLRPGLAWKGPPRQHQKRRFQVFLHALKAPSSCYM